MKFYDLIGSFLFVALVWPLPYLQAQTYTVESPDTNIVFTLKKDNSGVLMYNVRYMNRPFIQSSPIHLQVNAIDLGQPDQFLEPKRSELTSSFPVRGNYSKVDSRMKTAVFQCSTKDLTYQFEVKVSNNGVGFRFVVPNSDKTPLTITDEKITITPISNIPIYAATQYEGRFEKKDLDTINTEQFFTFPILLQGTDQFGIITEVQHHKYPAAGVQVIDNEKLQIQLNTQKGYATSHTIEDTLRVPWRALLLAKNLNRLANNSLVYELAESAKTDDTSWITYGKSAWSWITEGFKGQKPENIKKLIDGAAQMKWPYVIVDDGWEHWKNKWKEVEKLCSYAASKNVKVLLWKPADDYLREWQQKKFGPLPEINGLMDPEYRNEFFENAKKAGVAGFKIDFVDEKNLEQINRYQLFLEEALRHKMVINFHGSNLPTGMDRTYPNEVTREAVRGLEYLWNEKTPLYPQMTIHPFLRMVTGPADYTPLLGRYHPIAGSRAFQLASTFMITSPLMAMAVDPSAAALLPEAEVLKTSPTTWDETIILSPSQIGKVVALAKRKGKDWYVAVCNGDKSQNLVLDFKEFLPRSTSFSGTFYTDPKGYEDTITVSEINGTSDFKKTLMLLPGQGFVAVLKAK